MDVSPIPLISTSNVYSDEARGRGKAETMRLFDALMLLRETIPRNEVMFGYVRQLNFIIDRGSERSLQIYLYTTSGIGRVQPGPALSPFG